MLEYNEQVKLFNWAKKNEKLMPDLWYLNASANGVRVTTGQASKMVASGMKAGYPDIFLPVPKGNYHGLFIELKTDKGAVSLSQKVWINKLTDKGYYCVVCYGADEAIAVIKLYLNHMKNIKI